MKRVFLLALLLCTGTLFCNAQESPKKENIIYLTGSSGFSRHNQILAIAKVEYNRQIKGNWFWGASIEECFNVGRRVTYEIDPTLGVGDYNPYNNTVYQDVFMASAMTYYRIPIFPKWLSLRAGAGVGLGYHHMKEDKENPDGVGNKLLPYLNAELAWIVKLSKHIDLKLAPTVIGVPQSLSFSPVKLGGETDVNPMIYDAGFNLGLGVRF